MAVKLNRKGFAFGKELVNEGRSVRDERDVRSVERGFPSGISRECIVARCCLPRAARGNTSTWTLNEQRHICTR